MNVLRNLTISSLALLPLLACGSRDVVSEPTGVQSQSVSAAGVFQTTANYQSVEMTSYTSTICMITHLFTADDSGYLGWRISEDTNTGKWSLYAKAAGTTATCWNLSSFSHFSRGRFFDSTSTPTCNGGNQTCITGLGSLPFSSYACVASAISVPFDGNGTYPQGVPPYAQIFGDSVNYTNWEYIEGTTDLNIVQGIGAVCLGFSGNSNAPGFVTNVSSANGDSTISLPDSNTAACGVSGMFGNWRNANLVAAIDQTSIAGSAFLYNPDFVGFEQVNVTCIYFNP